MCFSENTPETDSIRTKYLRRQEHFPNHLSLIHRVILVMFVCRTCQKSFNTISQYDKHQIVHRDEINLKIICLYPNCKTNCGSYLNFRQHIVRYHGNEGGGLFFCKHTHCSLSFQNLHLLKKHQSSHLKLEESCTYICGFCNDKTIQFETKNAYKIHISRCHKLLDDHDFRSQANDRYCNVRITTDSNESRDIDVDISNECDVSFPNSIEILKNNKAGHDTVRNQNANTLNIFSNLYANLSAKHLATEPLIQNVVDSVLEGYKICHDDFLSSLKATDLSLDNVNKVEQILCQSFRDISNTHQPAGIFNTAFRRNAYHKQSDTYVKPIPIHFKNERGLETEFHFTYVPILETLQAKFKDRNMYRACFSVEQESSISKALSDINDGTVVKNNPFFRDNPKALKIILFQDAFEICNPLGSSRGKFKLLGMYMMIGNIPAHLRSKSENIKLVALCPEKLLRGINFFIDY